MQPDFRASLSDLRIRLEHVQQLSAFEQLRHLWPTVEQLMVTIEAMGESIESLIEEHRK